MKLKPLIIGHRGARSCYPEHTLAGYKYAIECGVDMVDLDVVVTKDKVLVAYHDLIINPDTTFATSKDYLFEGKEAVTSKITAVGDTFSGQQKCIKNREKYLIKNFTAQELQANFLIKLNRQSNYAKFFTRQQDISNAIIPSMQQVVDYVNNLTNSSMPFQIEIKNDLANPNYSYSYQELAEIVHNFIIENNLVDRIKVQAFDWRILVAINQLNTSIKTAYLKAYDFKVEELFLDPIIEGKAFDFIKYFGVKYKVYKLEDFACDENILYLIHYLGGYSYEPEDNELTLSEVKLAHKLGLKVYVWTWPEHSGFVTNPEVIKRLNSWGIDGFIADDPVMVKQILNKFT